MLGLSASVAAMSFLPGCAAKPVKEPARIAHAHRSGVDKIVVKKSQRRLYLMRGGEPLRTYRVSLGVDPVGPKQRRGDNKTPEGRYTIDWRNGSSRFHKALHISYPGPKDRLQAQRRGWDPGGSIMIHGEPRAPGDRDLREMVRNADWTQGCIAVSNLAIEEIWQYTRDGTPIEILP